MSSKSRKNESSLLSLSLSLLAFSSLTTMISAQQQECHDYVLVSVRGTYEVQGPSFSFPGMVNTTLRTLPNGIEYDAVYPASPNGTAPLGAADVTRYINAGLQSCPNQVYAILGYSQGARATQLVLSQNPSFSDPDSPAYKAIRAVLVVGNPFHKPNSPNDIDESGGNTTTQYPGNSYGQNQTGVIPDIYYSSGKLLDICYQGDIICAPGYPDANFVPNHLKYGATESVQTIGAEFLIKRLNSTSSGNGTTTTTTTSGPRPTYTGGAVAGFEVLTGSSALLMVMSMVVGVVFSL